MAAPATRLRLGDGSRAAPFLGWVESGALTIAYLCPRCANLHRHDREQGELPGHMLRKASGCYRSTRLHRQGVWVELMALDSE